MWENPNSMQIFNRRCCAIAPEGNIYESPEYNKLLKHTLKLKLNYIWYFWGYIVTINDISQIIFSLFWIFREQKWMSRVSLCLTFWPEILLAIVFWNGSGAFLIFLFCSHSPFLPLDIQNDVHRHQYHCNERHRPNGNKVRNQCYKRERKVFPIIIMSHKAIRCKVTPTEGRAWMTLSSCTSTAILCVRYQGYDLDLKQAIFDFWRCRGRTGSNEVEKNLAVHWALWNLAKHQSSNGPAN